MSDVILFTTEDCKCLYEVLDQLTGGNPENVFAWDGSDDLADLTTLAAAKLFRAASKRIPDNLLGNAN